MKVININFITLKIKCLTGFGPNLLSKYIGGVHKIPSIRSTGNKVS